MDSHIQLGTAQDFTQTACALRLQERARFGYEYMEGKLGGWSDELPAMLLDCESVVHAMLLVCSGRVAPLQRRDWMHQQHSATTLPCLFQPWIRHVSSGCCPSPSHPSHPSHPAFTHMQTAVRTGATLGPTTPSRWPAAWAPWSS